MGADMTDMRSRPKAAVSSIVSGVEGLSIVASDADCTAGREVSEVVIGGLVYWRIGSYVVAGSNGEG